MSSPIIEELSSDSSCFTFYKHSGFDKDLKKYRKRKHPVDDSVGYLVNLLDSHLDSKKPERPLKLELVPDVSSLPIYKSDLIITGLRKNQYPRVYLLILPTIIIFLSSDGHTDNYKDRELRESAILRAKEVIEELEVEDLTSSP